MPVRRVLVLGLCLLGGCAGEAAHGRPWVHEVRFRGLDGVDVRALKERLAVEETSWAPWARKKWLDQFALDGDRERVEAWLVARGYYGARVTDARVLPRKHGSADVEIIVEQGPLVRVGRVEVTGAEPKAFPLKAGDPFDHDRYLAAKQALLAALMDAGLPWPQVTGAVTVDRASERAEVRLEVAPGPRAVIGAVEVVGTQRVDPQKVARHTGLSAGEPYRPDRIEEARGRVFQLGLFSSVEVQLEPLTDTTARVRIVVHDAPASETRLGLGLGIEAQRNDVHGRVAWVRHGLAGGLRRLRLSLDPAYVAIPAVWDIQRQGPAATAELELTQLDVPWRLSTITFIVGYDLGIDYAYQYHGPRTQLAFAQALWRDRVHLALAYNFQFLDFFNTEAAILQDPIRGGAVFGYQDPYRVGWFQEEASLDLRDRPLDAHSGAYLALAAEEGGVYAGGAFTYEKLTPEVRGYLPFGARGTLAARIQFGQIFSHGDSEAPITRRLYLGGPASHRGFNYNRLSPQAIDVTTGVRVPVGGEQSFLAQLELRVEVWKLAGSWLGMVVFTDAGDVVGQGNIDFAALNWAVGGGLRYKTVLGTLRFDVAGRLNRLSVVEPDGRPNPDPGQPVAFHLSLGEAF
jgi:translocation and assembly module TamA